MKKSVTYFCLAVAYLNSVSIVYAADGYAGDAPEDALNYYVSVYSSVNDGLENKNQRNTGSDINYIDDENVGATSTTVTPGKGEKKGRWDCDGVLVMRGGGLVCVEEDCLESCIGGGNIDVDCECGDDSVGSGGEASGKGPFEISLSKDSGGSRNRDDDCCECALDDSVKVDNRQKPDDTIPCKKIFALNSWTGLELFFSYDEGDPTSESPKDDYLAMEIEVKADYYEYQFFWDYGPVQIGPLTVWYEHKGKMKQVTTNDAAYFYGQGTAREATARFERLPIPEKAKIVAVEGRVWEGAMSVGPWFPMGTFPLSHDAAERTYVMWGVVPKEYCRGDSCNAPVSTCAY